MRPQSFYLFIAGLDPAIHAAVMLRGIFCSIRIATINVKLKKFL
jgi:hypothetical protein